MTDIPAPPFCSLLAEAWPATLAPPGVALTGAELRLDEYSPDDFERCGIPFPESLRTAVTKRQAEYLGGRHCARMALQSVGGGQDAPGRDAEGIPRWPPGFVGSITHGKGWIAAAAGRQSTWLGLGIDIERRLADARAQRLVDAILTPDERRRIPRTDLLAQVTTLTFSLKESLFKALFPIVRQRFYFEDAELVEWQEDGTARLRLLTTLSPEWSRGRELDARFAPFDEHLISLVAIPVSAAR